MGKQGKLYPGYLPPALCPLDCHQLLPRQPPELLSLYICVWHADCGRFTGVFDSVLLRMFVLGRYLVAASRHVHVQRP